MALQQADLFVVQQGVTVKSVDYGTLSSSINSAISSGDLPIATAAALGAVRVGANLAIDPSTGVLEATLPPAINFAGQIDPTDPAPAASIGDAYIVSPGGVFDSSFDNLAGKTGLVGDLCIYEGTVGHEWDLLSGLFGVGVISIKGTDPVEVDSSDSNNPVISVKDVAPATGGIGGQKGIMSAIDKEKLDGIAVGAEVGTVTEVKGTAPIQVTNGTDVPLITVDSSTTTDVGVVRLADSTAVTNGTAGRVVDASQLKTVSDSVTALDLKVDNLSLYTFLGDDPIDVAVDVNDNVTYSIKDASETQKGALRLATSTEVGTATDTTHAVHAAGIAAHYLIKDFSQLQTV